MNSSQSDEVQRTTALAYWRYAHDYLRVAKTLCGQNRVRCAESQAAYHVAAQGLEFALKSYLRAKGLSTESLRTEVGHSLTGALERSIMLGMSPLPDASRACIEWLAPHHQEGQFTHVDDEPEAFVDVRLFVATGIQILDRIVPDVVADYVDHHAVAASPPAAEFVHRLRADLLATADGIAVPA